MTNERAITIIDDVNAYLASRSIYENDSIAGYTYRVICEALTQLKQSALAIKTLEQEDVLDNIKAEIEKLNPVDYGSMYSYESHNGAREMKRDVLEIIDEYRKGGAE